MTVGDFVTMDAIKFDYDVYDNYDERCAYAVCPPVKLTHEGNERFLDALTLNIQGFYNDNAYGVCSLVVDCPTSKDAQNLKEFLMATAGHCSVEDTKKWFADW